jgi:hypothetical protein
MFKKLFSRDKLRPLALAMATTDSSIHQPLATGAAGLQTQFSSQISQIAQTSGVSSQHFNQHFLPVIKQLLFTFQSLPATHFASHDRLYGLSDLCLLGGLNALKIRRGMVLPPGIRTDLIDSQRTLWSFVVFCAGLTLIIRKNLTQWLIETSPNAQQFSVWDITKEPLGHSAFFRFRKSPCQDDAFAIACASSLMNGWIESATMSWLVSDKQVYGELSAILNSNPAYCPVLKSFLIVDTVFNNRQVPENLSEDSLSPKPSNADPSATDVGFEHPFYIWLFKEIASGGLILNTQYSLVHTVEAGVFVKKSIARKYAKTMPSDPTIKQSTIELLTHQCSEVSYAAYDDILQGFQFDPKTAMPTLADPNQVLMRQSVEDEP